MVNSNLRHSRTEGNTSVSLLSALRGGEKGLRASLDGASGRRGPSSAERREEKRRKIAAQRAKIGY